MVDIECIIHDMKLHKFQEAFCRRESVVSALRQNGLLALSMQCASCQESIKERVKNTGDGTMFYCNRSTCRSAKSIRHESFFARSKLSLCDAMLFLHLWSKGYNEKLIINDFPFSNPTVVDWSQYCRDICLYHFETDNHVIGGPGIIVEIDETMAVKRKYNRGRMLKAGWLFGGIERRDDGIYRCFMRLVYDRSGPHLCHLIREHIAPGTHIISDGWLAYSQLGTMGYQHGVVIHEDNFVSPDDSNVHTQRIESTWSSLKRFIRSRGTHKGPHYVEYIYKYLFRRKFENVFDALINVIKTEYPFSNQ